MHIAIRGFIQLLWILKYYVPREEWKYYVSADARVNLITMNKIDIRRLIENVEQIILQHRTVSATLTILEKILRPNPLW